MTSEPKPKRTISKRLHHSPEVWAQARRDYFAGYTASAVSKHYGMSVDAIRKRASKQERRALMLTSRAPISVAHGVAWGRDHGN